MISAGWVEKQTERAVCFRLPKGKGHFWFPKSRIRLVEDYGAVELNFWDGWTLNDDGVTSADKLLKDYADAKEPNDEHAGNMFRMLQNSGLVIEEPDYVKPEQKDVAKELRC